MTVCCVAVMLKVWGDSILGGGGEVEDKDESSRIGPMQVT